MTQIKNFNEVSNQISNSQRGDMMFYEYAVGKTIVISNKGVINGFMILVDKQAMHFKNDVELINFLFELILTK